jgi:hypothetical protein
MVGDARPSSTLEASGRFDRSDRVTRRDDHVDDYLLPPVPLACVKASAVAAALDGVAFPVRPWQLVIAAEDFGVDPLTRAKIDQIPDREYSDVFDIVVALTSTPAHLRSRRPL